MQKIVDSLVAEMEKMPIIDAHEHLPTEAEVIAQTADVFTRIYCHYSITSTETAGMPAYDGVYPREMLHDTSIPLQERWRRFRPYLDAIRETGYARAAQITARDLYGIEDINDDTYEELSRRLQADNTPGIYDRVFRDKCKIECVLNQGPWVGQDGDLAREVSWDLGPVGSAEMFRGKLQSWTQQHGGEFADPEDCVRHVLTSLVASGAVGLKFHASLPIKTVPTPEAQALLTKTAGGKLTDEETFALETWLAHKGIELASEFDLVVAVHCGILFCCWMDFTPGNPTNLIPLIMKYRSTTFDLYHGGIPWVREIAVMANQYPNVNLNLIWCHQISPYMTENMLNEWIDLVPLNKIIGFGGDNAVPEKTYGVLVMARENIARALAVRIARGQMSESRAADICRMWLYDNPKRIYGL